MANSAEVFGQQIYNDPSLTYYWRFEGNSNSTKGSNNGTDTAVTYSTGNGKFVQGAGFNGSTSKIVLASLPIPTGSGDMTINFWFNTSSANRMGLISFGDFVSPTATAIYCYIYTDHKLHFDMNAVGGPVSAGTVNDGAWHMATYQLYNNATLELFLDGISCGTTSHSYNIGAATTNGKDIGTENGSNLFSGAIDDLATFNRRLSAQEVQMLYGLQTFAKTNINQPSRIGGYFM